MHGHQTNVFRLQVATVERRGKQSLLAGSVGRRQAAAAAVLVDGAATDVRPDGVAARGAVFCGRHTVQGEQQGSEAFAAAVPVGSSIKGLATAHWGQRLKAGRGGAGGGSAGR